MDADLAIIIPAFKKKYFKESLRSLRHQTSRRFTVYVGDDASPENLKSIVDEFSDLPLVYHRFDENLGGKNLVKQWERCVALSAKENWIWLFSDDDVAHPQCVEKFYDTLKERDVAVFRFNTATIDSAGNVGNYSAQGPGFESSESMAYHLLLGQRGNSMPDHIFSREVYTKNKGFVNTAFGQSADWATSILFSKEKGIQIIPEAILYWRRSGENISSLASKKRATIQVGYLQFVEWIVQHFQYLKEGNLPVSYEQIVEALRFNFLLVMTYHYGGISWRNFGTTIRVMRRALELSWFSCIHYVFKIYSRTGFVVRLLVRCKRLIKLLFQR